MTAFRSEAVKLTLEQKLTIPGAAKLLGIPEDTLKGWVKIEARLTTRKQGVLL